MAPMTLGAAVDERRQYVSLRVEEARRRRGGGEETTVEERRRCTTTSDLRATELKKQRRGEVMPARKKRIGVTRDAKTIEYDAALSLQP
ncbi:hypothetical protein EYF80_049138 [Liparis tanakae]|uniref:Uncharacterized protein n=1 Tax=Liparis tanakae TaxID=230148 RepID=A0A4Z2FHI5_9TELE|nr:hypothetical protein EYF80_049138 [Liparis tanakae]